jgi:TrmH family RNA methyltransferase
MAPIQSAQNNQFKRLLTYSQDAAARLRDGVFLVEGPHLVGEAIRHGLAKEVWASPEALLTPEGVRLGATAKIQEMGASLLGRLCDTRQPQGWLALAKRPTLDGLKPTLWLALDALQDPGNVGTLLRCAWAAKAGVLLGEGCADVWSPKVLRSASGAHFETVLKQGPLAPALDALKAAGCQIAAADPQGSQPYTGADWTKPTVFVVGAEGAGLSAGALKAAQLKVRIPYPGGAESLNAGISGALLLFEALRQRS